jgi:tetratricopeptide (TPR) repeat protein
MRPELRAVYVLRVRPVRARPDGKKSSDSRSRARFVMMLDAACGSVRRRRGLQENAMARIASYSLVFGTWLALAATAFGQGVIDMGGMSDQEAKSHFKVGKSLYETGRFSEAAAEFEKAYALSNKVELLYNVYVAHRDASDLPKAIDALRRYLQLAQLDESARVNLQARLRAMEEANSRAATAPAAAPAAAPQPGAEPAAEPQPSAEASQPPPEPAPAAAARSADYEVDADSSALPHALIAIGGAAVASGVVAAILAANKISDIEDSCEDDVCPPPSEFDLEGERDDARTLRTIAFALLGGGVVVGGAGVTLLVLDSGEPASSEPGPQAGLRCGAAGCVGTVSGRF